MPIVSKYAEHERVTESRSRYRRRAVGFGRKAKWTPADAGPEDADLWRQLEHQYGTESNRRTRDRVRAEIDAFCRNNAAQAEALGVNVFGLCAAQMSRATMRFSTIDTYFGYYRGCPKGDMMLLFREAHAIVKTAHADEERRQPATAMDDAVSRVIESTTDPAVCACLCLLQKTGARVRDLSRLRRSQIELSGAGLRVEFRVMKNRRTRALRTRVTFKHSWSHIRIPSRAWRYITRGLPSQRLFGHITAGVLNLHIKARGACFTTKAFRRAFVDRMLETFDGSIEEVSKYTLHLNPAVITAHYRSWKPLAETA